MENLRREGTVVAAGGGEGASPRIEHLAISLGWSYGEKEVFCLFVCMILARIYRG